MKKLRSIIILLILILVPMSILSAEKIDEDEYRTYFLVESENEYSDHVRIDYSFRGEKSSVVVSDGGIEVAKFTYLKEDEISSILSKSWILDASGYDTTDHLTTARTVVEAIRSYLDSRYPYTGNLTAETANAHFSDTISFVLTPYQSYSVTYFQVLSHITPDEVNYFSATYSAGADISWDHRFTKDFGVGATCGINSMFQMKAAMFRLGTVEFTTRMGFGGYITINENSVSFVPGIRASLGLNITVSPNISFIIESGLDVGLWLWRSMSSEGFVLAMQKPISLGVGVRI